MRESLAELAIRGRVHPHTGLPIQPVGFRKSGSPIWPVMGASEEDEGGDGTAGGDEDVDDEGDEDEGDDEEDAEAKAEAERKRKANADSKRHRIENKRLQKELDARDKRLKEFEDKDKGDAERLTDSNSELTAKLEKAEKHAADLALRNAFLANTDFQWVDPQAALKLADLSKIEIDDDGEVEGLDDALKALAKAKPYLVKKQDDEDEAPRPAGQPPRARPATTDNKRRSELEKKYPAIRR